MYISPHGWFDGAVVVVKDTVTADCEMSCLACNSFTMFPHKFEDSAIISLLEPLYLKQLPEDLLLCIHASVCQVH